MTEPSAGRGWRRAGGRGDDPAADDPFALLGLPTRLGLSDDDVHAAWRRIAAATHPDREDGGDPARFGAAAAAYVMLRTGFSRGEALADLGVGAAPGHRGGPARGRQSARRAASGAGRHRARHTTAAARPTRVRLGELTRFLGWTGRRGAAHRPPDASGQAPTGAHAHGWGAETACGSGGGTARVAGGETAHGWGAETACASGGGTIRVAGGETANGRPPGWRLRRRAVTFRLGGLAVRVAGAGVVCMVAVVIAGWSPGVVGVLAGVLTWVLATAGRALRRRRSQ